MFDTLYTQIGAGLTIAVALFAFLKGDEPERIGAGAYVFLWFASLLVQNDSNIYHLPWSVFALDLIMLLILSGLTWKSNRAWPLWATALQLLAVASHLFVMIDLRPSLTAFYTVLNIASYGVLLSIAIGTFWAWQERRAQGLE
ncbi:hypothetical protein E4M02_00465 [Brevundimonas sp. S30B]|uniref:hypothetical protein n=1 Tax=unclassified Brevundimonas TaxID=2622653 RepID=UPI001071E6B1|nr:MULTISPECIES: hypothetical protein [unclassified Brevundimonas]QBX37603.1 hypothetical protein E4M01_07355 [Brevundimonas sp. MF30-B]TFW03604.1 hypothetical protein E4M02_00465 [Brevundimonas sp. S30B]